MTQEVLTFMILLRLLYNSCIAELYVRAQDSHFISTDINPTNKGRKKPCLLLYDDVLERFNSGYLSSLLCLCWCSHEEKVNLFFSLGICLSGMGTADITNHLFPWPLSAGNRVFFLGALAAYLSCKFLQHKVQLRKPCSSIIRGMLNIEASAYANNIMVFSFIYSVISFL